MDARPGRRLPAHISNGYGFINPKENPGDFPLDEARMFFDTNRHLTTKAALRAAVMHLPKALVKPLADRGWGEKTTLNLEDARRFRAEVGLPVIANGGFQNRSEVGAALTSGGADLVSMARPLLANPDLPKLFEAGVEEPRASVHDVQPLRDPHHHVPARLLRPQPLRQPGRHGAADHHLVGHHHPGERAGRPMRRGPGGTDAVAAPRH